MLITGRRVSNIKSYDDPYTRCSKCDSQKIRFTVYREYFHCFFIPLFPSDIKDVKGYCINCGAGNGNRIKEEYLEKTSTPIYFYTGLIIFIGLIAMIIIISNR